MKNKKTKTKVSRKNITPELPQNILPVGERVFDNKNIYIHQKVYSQIHKFASNKTENEHGGILVGRVVNEMDKENTIIEGFIEAKHNAATPTTLTFTHETWEYFHAEIERKYKDKKIVGWIHTHPNFGIFLSENDKFIQENFFTDSNQVAYVVDPIQSEEGFFFWINEKIERCPGFYLFDKNGAKIKQDVWSNTGDSDDNELRVRGKSKVLTIILVLALIANIFATLYQGKRIEMLEKQIDDQNIVLRYGVFGAEVSSIADSIRAQLEAQKKAEMQIVKESMKEKKEQESGETEKSEKQDNQKKTDENNGGNK